MNTTEEKATIDTVRKVSPAVVSIVISKYLPKMKQLGIPSPFGPFDFVLPEDESAPKEPVKIGGGSGFFVHPDGLILTNKHVVFDQDAEYSVITQDEKEYSAKVLSRDPINDIAIIKIEVKNMPVLELGDSSRIDLGQSVIAIGTALGLFANSVSKGIVSGLSRKITASLGGSAENPETEELRGVIQTDVAINQGNSGGPLVNMNGEVIGINTAIIYGAQNIGFAIPVNWAKKDLEDILKYGRVVKPYIGLRYVMLNEKTKEKYQLTVDYGALVVRDRMPQSTAVVPKSPADKAGLKENDIILAVNGEKLTPKNELTDVIQKFEVGAEIELEYLRGDKSEKTKLKLEERI